MSLTRYQQTWSREFSWVKEIPNKPFLAHCSLCNKDFCIQSMGRQALVSHAKSIKHKSVATAKISTLNLFFPTSSILTNSTSVIDSSNVSNNNAETSNNVTTKMMVPNNTLKQNSLQNYLHKDKITQREIMWCLGTVMSHESLRGSENRINLFKTMFSDIPEVQELKLSKMKICYTNVYGLGPYFQKEIVNNIKSCEFYVFGFDETYNKIAQKQQMDINVRFWSEEKNEVCTRFITSVFLTSTNAESLLNAFKKATENFDLQKILQISMDGPHVNFKFLRLLKQDIKTQHDGDDVPEMIDIGSCGLHKVHGAFKSAIQGTNWDLIEFLKSIYYLFQNAPSPRGDFTRITNSTLFPLKFCAIRWVENLKVAIRALKVLPTIKRYVEKILEEKKRSSCKSFDNVEKFLEDKLLNAKLAFFIFVAENIEPFLIEFQTDAPMVPFLYDSLVDICQIFLNSIVKPDVLKSTKFFKINLQDKENLQSIKQFNLSYGVREALRGSNGLKEIDVITFRKECMNATVTLLEKLIEQSPLKFSITKALGLLNPTKMLSSNVKEMLATLLDALLKAKRISGNKADKISKEFMHLTNLEKTKELVKNYDRNQERVDHFWIKMLNDDESKWDNLKYLIKISLTLSHGNANLERGFSINKECLVENLNENSLIAQRNIYDAVTAAGGIENINISKSMILAARNAYSKYMDACAKKKTEDLTLKRKAEDRKQIIKEKIELQVKRSKMMNEIDDKKKELAEIEHKMKSLN